MDRWLRDMRVAMRGFRRSRTFTAAVVAILALGVGMAVAMFTVTDTVLLRRLPVREPDRLVVLWTYQTPGIELSIGRETFDQLAHESRTLAGIAGFVHWGATPRPLVDGERTLVMLSSLVTGNYFDVLGAKPLLGRLLRAEDEAPGASNVAVLSYATWKRNFGGDPKIVGRQLTEPYEQKHYTIVGVAPPGLDYPVGTGYWIPVWPGKQLQMTVVARLASNATPSSARSEFFATAQRLAPTWNFTGADVFTLTDAITGKTRPVLVVLTAAVALLLLIACVNVGNLLLLRATTRSRELAIRRAIGASQRDIVRQLMVESIALALAGGVAGLALAMLLVRGLIILAPERLPRLDALHLTAPPAVIAIGATVVALVLFGVVPSLGWTRGASPLRLDARIGSETKQRRRLRRMLVTSQVALALIMLAGAGLLARSLDRLQRVDLGYTPEHLSILALAFPAETYDSTKITALGEELSRRFRAIPGVSAVTPVLIPPFFGPNVMRGQIALPGQTPAEQKASPYIPVEIGGSEYFKTFGIPIVRGRGFLESDRENAPQIAVVSAEVARKYWPNDDPIGKRIRYWSADTLAWRTVVGVAGDIRYRSIRDGNPSVYLPWRQAFWQGNFAIRTRGALGTVVPALRREIRAVNPKLALWQAQSMDELMAVPLAQPRLSTLLLSGFGLVALLLASIGLYGVMASAVRDQSREIGVRMALGATPRDIQRRVLRDALIVIGGGAVVGLVGALLSARLIAALLYGVSPEDPLALASAAALLIATGLVAAYVPARRATRVDPAKVLRAD